MDHQQAMQSGMCERYLLAELTPEECEQFEEHYFGCEACSADVASGTALVDQMQALPRGVVARLVSPTEDKSSGWWQGLQAWLQPVLRPGFALPAMAAMLVAIASLSTVVVRQSHEYVATAVPQALPLISVRVTRAGTATLPAITPAANGAFLLALDVTTSAPQFAAYQCEVLAPSGRVEMMYTLSAEQISKTLYLPVAAGRREPGVYSVVVRGEGGGNAPVELTKAQFELKAAR